MTEHECISMAEEVEVEYRNLDWVDPDRPWQVMKYETLMYDVMSCSYFLRGELIATEDRMVDCTGYRGTSYISAEEARRIVKAYESLRDANAEQFVQYPQEFHTDTDNPLDEFFRRPTEDNIMRRCRPDVKSSEDMTPIADLLRSRNIPFEETKKDKSLGISLGKSGRIDLISVSKGYDLLEYCEPRGPKNHVMCVLIEIYRTDELLEFIARHSSLCELLESVRARQKTAVFELSSTDRLTVVMDSEREDGSYPDEAQKEYDELMAQVH